MQFNRKFVAPRPRWYAIQFHKESGIEKVETLGIILDNVSNSGGIISCKALLNSEQRAQVSKVAHIKPL
jgi:hypothetical protein